MRLIIFFYIVSIFSTTLALGMPIPDGATLDVGFSPNGDAIKLVIDAIEEARQYILIASYSFTSYEVHEALLRAHKERGVSVSIATDYSNKNNDILKHLKYYGIKVRLNNHYKILHNKFMVIDGKHVETGSFNYTKSAIHSNAENVIVLWDIKILADIYEKEWNRLWNEGEELII